MHHFGCVNLVKYGLDGFVSLAGNNPLRRNVNELALVAAHRKAARQIWSRFEELRLPWHLTLQEGWRAGLEEWSVGWQGGKREMRQSQPNPAMKVGTPPKLASHRSPLLSVVRCWR